MTLRRLLPEPGGPWEQDDDLASRLRELYAVPDAGGFVRINMIASLNGSAVGEDGTSETLSNRLDRAILKVVRSLSDAVVVGASTVRREGYLGPADATLAIVTQSGDLTGHRLGGAAHPPLVLRPVSAADAVARQLDDVPHRTADLREGDGGVDARDIVALLSEAGHRNIVCEGGPTLAAAFFDAGVVDEFCLTTAAKIHSPGVPLLGSTRDVDAELVQLLVDAAGTTYARWRIHPSA